MNLNEIKEGIKNGMDSQEAIRLLDDYIANNPKDDEAFTTRGMRYWAMEKRSLAINDYLQAIHLNPHSSAVQALKNANEILDFYNKDFYNP